ncbi:MAG: hypothetical protein ACXWP5_09350 [Bdellovibrionota bacterium]
MKKRKLKITLMVVAGLTLLAGCLSADLTAIASSFWDKGSWDQAKWSK